MRTTTLENTLRDLDPAPPTGEGRPARADADLHRILATPRDGGDRSDHRLSATVLPSAPALSSAVLDVRDGAPGWSPSPRRR